MLAMKSNKARKTKGIVAAERGPGPWDNDAWDIARPRRAPWIELMQEEKVAVPRWLTELLQTVAAPADWPFVH